MKQKQKILPQQRVFVWLVSLFLRQGLPVSPWLVWKSLYKPAGLRLTELQLPLPPTTTLAHCKEILVCVHLLGPLWTEGQRFRVALGEVCRESTRKGLWEDSANRLLALRRWRGAQDHVTLYLILYKRRYWLLCLSTNSRKFMGKTKLFVERHGHFAEDFTFLNVWITFLFKKKLPARYGSL